MYFDLWYLITEFSDAETRRNIQLVEKNALHAVESTPPLPRQISIMIQNNKNKFFKSEREWMEYFKRIPFIHLCEPFAVSYQKKNYRYMTMITKSCPKITIYFPVFLKNYNTTEEFFILLLSVYFKSEKCIQKCFRTLSIESQCLVFQKIYSKLKPIQKRQLQIYLDYSCSIGVDLTTIKNQMLNQ